MRTKGATSCVAVTLEELNRKFKPNAIIWVHRPFANQNGLIGTPIFSNRETMKSQGNLPAVEEVVEVREVE